MAQGQIPEEMTAVVLDTYEGVEALRVEKRPVPKPGKNEVLVKVAASPINPSDIGFLEGLYGFRKPTPVVPGFEGSGTVVATGGGLMGRYLHGKRVACVSGRSRGGTWAEYMVTSVNSALPLDKSVDLEQGAMAVVNPLTAMALLEIANEGGHKTIVMTAAASALGQMVNRLAQSEGVRVINIVRRDEQVSLLKERGATVVLNSGDDDFGQQLRDLCYQYKARLAYDAVAGTLTLQVAEAMPRHSKVTVFGALSYEAVQVHPGNLIFQDKSIDGFWLTTWLARKHFLSLLMLWRRTQKRLTAELKSDVQGSYPLHEAKEAVEAYRSDMTGGKVLLRPA